MNFPLIQIGVTLLLLFYGCIWRRGQSKKRGRSWEDLVARLHANQNSVHAVAEEAIEELWGRIGGLRGLWALYGQVPLLVEIADYAAEHGQAVDEELLCCLRADAFQIRLSVLSTIATYAFARSKSKASLSTSNSIASYREMLARVSTIVEAYTATAAPALC